MHGRCGYIRQAFPFIIKDYDFSKLSLLLDGPNSQLSDIDFYDATRRQISKTKVFEIDLASNYYQKNKFINYFQTQCDSIVAAYLNGLTQVLNYYEKNIYLKGSFQSMLDGIRNSLLGRPHYPHQHFMATGAHSISIVSHGTTAKDRKQRVAAMMSLFEKLVRIHDQLDEQLHAGFYFYILTAPAKFVSNTVFIWPLVLIALGVCLPVQLEYLTYTEKNEVDPKSRKYAFLFLVVNYSFGLLVFLLPEFILASNTKESCLA